MKKTTKILSVVLAGTMLLSMSACSKKAEETTAAMTAAETTSAAAETTTAAETEAQKEYKVGVLQLVQHNALDSACEGFQDALNDSDLVYTIDIQNAAGEQSACQTISEKLVNDGDDLILAIATPAAQAVASTTKDIPILVTAVTDPADAGLVNSNEVPGTNVSGTSDLTPVKEQIELLTKLIPDAKKVGVLYCSAESNSVLQANMAKEACDAAGLESEDFTVSSSNEIQTVVESMIGKVDVIYAPTDNMIAAGMETVSMVATDNGIPVICGESGMVDNGGLATYGIDYYQLGYMTGEQAAKILTGEADVSTMPIGYLDASKCELYINQDVADQLGIDTSAVQ